MKAYMRIINNMTDKEFFEYISGNFSLELIVTSMFGLETERHDFNYFHEDITVSHGMILAEYHVWITEHTNCHMTALPLRETLTLAMFGEKTSLVFAEFEGLIVESLDIVIKPL